MLISKRRFKWGILVFLIAGVTCFVRPVRTWMDQALVKQIDPDLRVSQVTFHRQASVLEVRDVEWSKESAERRFGMRADRAWFAIDPEPTIDRQISMPKGEIENALLFFNEYAPAQPTMVDVWSQEVAAHAGYIDWDAVRNQFATLLSPTQTHAGIRQQVDDWIRKSNEIKTQVERISGEETWDSNPLRLGDVLRARIQRLQELSIEHEQLVRSFEALPEEIDAKCVRLEEQLATRSRELANQMTSDQRIAESKKRIAEALMLQVAESNWIQIADCGQIAQLVAGNLPLAKPSEFDRNVPLTDEEQRFVSLGALKAKGTFAHRNRKTPFQMTASLDIGEFEAENARGNWNYAFYEGGRLIGVEANVDTREQVDSIELSVLSSDEPLASPSDAAVPNSIAHDSWKSREDYIVRIEIAQEAGLLAGTIEFTGEALGGLPTQSQAILRRALEKPDQGSLSFRVTVSGTWQAPRFRLEESLPSWFVEAIELEVNNYLVSANAEADVQLRDDFRQEIERLQELVELSTDTAEAILTTNASRLASVQASLQRRLDQLVGVDYSASRLQSVQSSDAGESLLIER
ncbi:MAG: hypothetical protein ACE361_10570 [Aureliella sp.]